MVLSDYYYKSRAMGVTSEVGLTIDRDLSVPTQRLLHLHSIGSHVVRATIQQLDTVSRNSQKRWIIETDGVFTRVCVCVCVRARVREREREREREWRKSVLPARLYDNDNIYIYIYIYMYVSGEKLKSKVI